MTTPAGGAVAAPTSTYCRSAWQGILIVAVFFGALIASWVALGRCLPFPEVPLVREKIEQLGHYGDDYDILFVGSSRVAFQVLPSIFDGMLHAQGIPERSFNAGVAAIRPPEDGYYLDQLLRAPHHRLRWVFLELMGLNPKADPTLTATRRSSYWHDWDRTEILTQRCFEECSAAWGKARRGETPWFESRQLCSQALGVWFENLGLFVENFSHFGRGDTLLRRQFGEAKERKDPSIEKGLAWDGWTFPAIAKPWTADPKRRTAFENDYASFLAIDQRFDPGDGASWKSLKAKLDRITQAGATPILIIPPTLAPKRYLPPELDGQALAVLDFSDPREHPELFEIDHRLDGQHLDYDGAEIFTREIAEKFLAIVKKSQPAP